MDEIFLIMDNPTDYESHPDVLGFAITAEEADKIVAKKTELYIAGRELQHQIIDVYYSIPTPDFEQHIERPKWPAGIAQSAITKEMREERERIKGKNDMIDQINSNKLKEVNIKRLELALPILKSAPIELQELFNVTEQTINLLLDSLDEDSPYFKQKTTKL